jgi:hypothetical protein
MPGLPRRREKGKPSTPWLGTIIEGQRILKGAKMAVVTRNLNETLLHASKTFIDVPWPPFTEHKETVGRTDVIAEYLRARRMELEIQKKASKSYDEDGGLDHRFVHRP